MTWPDGRVYEGEWVADVMEGQGKMCYPDGRIEEGQFVDGEYQK